MRPGIGLDHCLHGGGHSGWLYVQGSHLLNRHKTGAHVPWVPPQMGRMGAVISFWNNKNAFVASGYRVGMKCFWKAGSVENVKCRLLGR